MSSKLDKMIDKKKIVPKVSNDISIFDEAVDSAVSSIAPTLIPIDHILVNEDQPRQYFDQEALNHLITSIRDYGLLQPLVVYYDRTQNKNAILIAGERRLKALKALNYQEVPVFIIKDQGKIEELSLIENVQREDLSAVERADAIVRLKREKSYDYDEIAHILGKSHDTVRALEKIATLPDPIKDESRKKKVSLRELIKIERIQNDKDQQKAFETLLKRYQKTDDADSVHAQRKARKVERIERLEKSLAKISSDLKNISQFEFDQLEPQIRSVIRALNLLCIKYKD